MSDNDRVWELMKKIGICMFASWDGQELQARPMGAYVRPMNMPFSSWPTRAITKRTISESTTGCVSPSRIPALRIMYRSPAPQKFWPIGPRFASCGYSGQGVVELSG